MEYKYLTDNIKEMLKDSAENMDVDYEDLETYEYHSSTSPLSYYGAEPAWDEYDEDEFYSKQLEKLAKYIEADGFWEYIDFPYDEDNETTMELLNKECVDYLEALAYSYWN